MEKTFLSPHVETDATLAILVSQTNHLSKPRHSSPTPLHCANQAYTNYERDEDLDLNPQN